MNCSSNKELLTSIIRADCGLTHAAVTRIQMGMSCVLEQLFHFTYFVELEEGLIENELDHVLIGWSNDTPDINADEVCNYRWISIDELKHAIAEQPEQYTFWLKHIFEHYSEDFINCLAHESL